MYGRRSTLIVALLASVAGCGGSDAGASQQPSQTATTPAAPTTTAEDRRFECGGMRLPSPTAPAFAGRGPHLAVAGVSLRPDFRDDPRGSPAAGVAPADFSTFNLPMHWRAYDRKRRQDDPASAQLVVCLTGMRQRGTTPIHKCESGAFEVYPVIYRFEVYEARTGRRLGAAVIPSDARPLSSCPAMWTFRPGARPDPEPAQGVSEKTVTATFKPFIVDGKGMTG
jgi:hypothetical protein